MRGFREWRRGALVMGLLLLSAAPAMAARVRIHYAPVDEHGMLAPQAAGPSGGAVEKLNWAGGWEPYTCPTPRPTCMGTFTHPCTGQMVVVPLALPEGTPTMEYRTRRVIYNYGSYTVEVHFLPDGMVDVIYNSGLFRSL